MMERTMRKRAMRKTMRTNSMKTKTTKKKWLWQPKNLLKSDNGSNQQKGMRGVTRKL